MNQIYICMHCRHDMIVSVRDPEEMLLVTCQTCGGLHHLRQGIITKAFEVPAKHDVSPVQLGDDHGTL